MILVGVLVAFYLLWVPGNMQETPDVQLGGIENKPVSTWPFMIPGRRNNNNGLVRTPCRRRYDLQRTDPTLDRWVPSFTSKIEKPNVNQDNLKSESLTDISYNTSPKPLEISVNKNTNDVDLEQVIHVRYDQTPINDCLQTEPLFEMSTIRAEQPERVSPMDMASFRQKIQNTVIESNNKLKPNIETDLKKLCFELKTNSDVSDTFIGNNRRNFNDKDTKQENKADYFDIEQENDKMEQQSPLYRSGLKTMDGGEFKLPLMSNQIKQTNFARDSNFALMDDSNLMTNGERNNNKNLKYGKNDLPFMEPTRGKGIIDLSQSQVMLMENGRVCYACNSASDPTCSEPSRRTTVKYCSKDHNSCVTKTYKNRLSKTIIRDCAKSCEDSHLPTVEPKYTSCSLCHSDLCNGAYAITNHYTLVMVFISCVLYTFQTSPF